MILAKDRRRLEKDWYLPLERISRSLRVEVEVNGRKRKEERDRDKSKK
jgi:hypothetical protein